MAAFPSFAIASFTSISIYYSQTDTEGFLLKKGFFLKVLLKKILTQVFTFEFVEFPGAPFFIEHLWTTASDYCWINQNFTGVVFIYFQNGFEESKNSPVSIILSVNDKKKIKLKDCSDDILSRYQENARSVFSFCVDLKLPEKEDIQKVQVCFLKIDQINYLQLQYRESLFNQIFFNWTPPQMFSYNRNYCLISWFLLYK